MVWPVLSLGNTGHTGNSSLSVTAVTGVTGGRKRQSVAAIPSLLDFTGSDHFAEQPANVRVFHASVRQLIEGVENFAALVRAENVGSVTECYPLAGNTVERDGHVDFLNGALQRRGG
jgi:hypothetical protein